MAGELICVDDGRVTWSEAVAKVAAALNPLGSAAEIVARISACVIEINRFKQEKLHLDRQYELAVQLLRMRQSTIVAAFEWERLRAARVDVDLKEVRQANRQMLQDMNNMRISREERMMSRATVPVLCGHLVEIHARGAHGLVRLSELLQLGNIEIVMREWKQLDP